MKTPREKYMNDPEYRHLVQMFEALIHRAEFTPSEIREAAMLACINHEMRKPMPIIYNKKVVCALDTLEKFTTSESRS